MLSRPLRMPEECSGSYIQRPCRSDRRCSSALTHEETAMSVQVVVHWVCAPCEVEGRDPGNEPACWNCGRPVTVIARPTIPVAGDTD